MNFKFHHSVLLGALLMAGCSSSQHSSIKKDEVQRIEDAMQARDEGWLNDRALIYKASSKSDEQFVAALLSAWQSAQQSPKQGLADLKLLDPTSTSIPAKQLYYLTYAEISLASRDPISASRSILSASEITDAEQRGRLQLRAWQLLLATPLETLRAAAVQYKGSSFEGWLKLSQWQQQVDLSGVYDVSSLTSWLQANPEHPAWQYWRPQGTAIFEVQLQPQEANSTVQVGEHSSLDYQLGELSNPEAIFVLLPLSGQYSAMASAVKSGIEAALGSAAQLTFIDTNMMAPSQVAATLPPGSTIIGPLLKPDVAAFAQAGSSPRIWLALNHIDHSQQSNTYFMGLDPADEISQIVGQMIAQHHNKVLLLLPDTANGHRYHDLFMQAVSQRSTDLAVTVEWLQQDDSDPSRLLAIIDPDRRRQQMMITGQPPSDPLPSLFDAIFVDGSASDVTRIHDFITLYVDPRVQGPIFYLGSKANESSQIPPWDDVLTLTTPILTKAKANIYQQAVQLLPSPNADQLRLFALGYDAGVLLPQLSSPDSTASHPSQHDGASGTLTINADGTINRELSWDQ
ncbi:MULTISPECIES: penicillin-binding protein activator [Aeromonas]|uniref:Penicillin-binding protein activator n=1 Tax=Aeromonas veronii TaxID=654 RepID=A0A4S5CKN3_AERVE|nr:MULTISPECIES: penicillin-binding protein activator [Aeromonas]THJ44935.1 hypothetical protein E8Q35_12145 [Aeromonas veronii]